MTLWLSTRCWSFGLILLLRLFSVWCQYEDEEEEEFTPEVTHSCERGQMRIVVKTQRPFNGIVHPRDYRTGECAAHGQGRLSTTLLLELLADKDDARYCGVQIRKPNSGEVTVALEVRVHPTLELSADKHYFLTCGSGFRNARNETSRVTLNFYQNNKRVQELIYNQEYLLKAVMTKPDDIHKLKVRSCLSFARNNTEVKLIDSNGCPLTHFLSEFRYNETSHSSEATLTSTFKFPDSNRVHVQCEIVLCRGPCEQFPCRRGGGGAEPRALPRIRNGTEDGRLMASTSVYVLEPGDPILAASLETCTEWRFPWLIGLCICLAILLLVMLIVNIFLCSSLTCTCTKTEVVDKEPSEMDDYDPYRVGWVSGSHYGSRSSLHKPGYTSGGSTLNSTARSVSNASDHYAIVHSRPGSRYSQHSSKEPLHKSSGSILSNGNHYNHRM